MDDINLGDYSFLEKLKNKEDIRLAVHELILIAEDSDTHSQEFYEMCEVLARYFGRK